jgi:hypothetical protein
LRFITSVLEPLDEQSQRSLEDVFQISVRNPMAEEGLGAMQVIESALTTGELQLEAPWREYSHTTWMGWRRNWPRGR